MGYTSEFHQTEEEAALDHGCISSERCLESHLQNLGIDSQSILKIILTIHYSTEYSRQDKF